MRLVDCHNIDDFRALARRRLPWPVFDYIDGGADDELTKARNTAAYADCDLVPDVLAGADGAGIVINTQGVSGQLRTILPLIREHKAWRDALGKSARKRVLDSYTLTGNVDRIEHLYGEILAPARAAG